jgi:serine/threonine protein kinase/tetratricopeptide (TPR) repeat protein
MTEEQSGDDTTRTVALLASGTVVSHYRIIRAMASGGMGEVYVAEDVELDRKVALKFMPRHLCSDDQAVARFRREAKAAATLVHPNIVTIHEVSDYKQRPFIAMELVEGKTFVELIREADLKLPEILDLSIQVGEGLQAAHDAGIVHRDIKPANILIDSEQRVRIVDFGLALVENEDGLTKTGSTLGTIGYMSPEQVRGEAVDRRSDIFSFGVVLYEMLTGKQPFRRDSHAATMNAIVNEEPDPMTHYVLRVPESLTRVVEKTLRKPRENRYQTMADLVADLRTVQAEVGSEAETIRKKPPTEEMKHGRNLIWTPVVALILLIAVLVIIPSTRNLLKSIIGLKQAPSVRHLVVLPFENIGGGSENQVFCDGLMETITAKLTGLEQLGGDFWVVPASDVRRRGIVSVDQSRKAFNANIALGGSVQRLGERVRLTFNLADAKTGRQLRSRVIDADLRDVYALQDSTVIEVAEMLEIALQPDGQQLLIAGGTTQAQAYDLYLKGQGYLQNDELAGYVDSAIGMFNRALERDPRYSLALAGLGTAYWQLYVNTRDPQWVEPALEKCNQAVALDAQIAPVYVTLGRIYYGTGKYSEAIAEFQRALDKDPVNYEALWRLARTYEAVSEFQEAEATYRKLIDLRPGFVNGYQRLALFYTRRGRSEEAIEQLQKVVELIPEEVKAYSDLGSLYFRVGREDEAVDMWRHSLAIEPNYAAYSNLGVVMQRSENFEAAAAMYDSALRLDASNFKVWGNLAFAYEEIPERTEEAEAAFRKAVTLAEERRKVNPRNLDVLLYLTEYYSEMEQRDSVRSLARQALELAPDNPKVLVRTAGVYEHLGQRDNALELLEKAVRLGYSTSEIEHLSEFRTMQNDPRFQSLLEGSDDTRRSDSTKRE